MQDQLQSIQVRQALGHTVKPRQWADAIAPLPTRDDRRIAVKTLVPLHLQSLVITHLNIRWQWQQFAEQQQGSQNAVD